MKLLPANFFYAKYALPRGVLRDLAEQGIIRHAEKMSIDGVNMMKLYCDEDVEAYLSGGISDDNQDA